MESELKTDADIYYANAKCNTDENIEKEKHNVNKEDRMKFNENFS